jgi:cyclic pyranopterin phosphate synthase
MAPETFALAIEASSPKGDIRAVAEVAGVMAGKRTAELIPLCHPLPLSSINVSVTPDAKSASFIVTARAKTVGQTGVEMEALTAVSVACLAIYDMLKAIDRRMVIEDVTLQTKSGGASGAFQRDAP